MDYGDLQRIVRRLSDTLKMADRAYDDLTKDYEELSERLTRSMPAYVSTSEWPRELRIYPA